MAASRRAVGSPAFAVGDPSSQARRPRRSRETATPPPATRTRKGNQTEPEGTSISVDRSSAECTTSPTVESRNQNPSPNQSKPERNQANCVCAAREPDPAINHPSSGPALNQQTGKGSTGTEAPASQSHNNSGPSTPRTRTGLWCPPLYTDRPSTSPRAWGMTSTSMASTRIPSA